MTDPQQQWGTQLWYGPPARRSVVSWGLRAYGAALDGVCCGVFVMLATIFALALPGAVGAVCALITYCWLIVFWIWNFVYRQGVTGQTIGKSIAGTKLVGEGTGKPIGSFGSFMRLVCHVVDAAPLGAGFLAPLWDPRRRTWADRAVGTLVVPVEAAPDTAPTQW